MEFRMAQMEDLPQLKAVFLTLVQYLHANNITIWDEEYPCDFFQEDIKQNRLYLLLDGTEIVSAFALCDSADGEDQMPWENKHAKASYLNRFGVNVQYLKHGIGSIMLRHALTLAREKGAAYLRLFVVETNQPAIHLYLKNGFYMLDGMYHAVIDDELTLHERAFEAKTE